MKYVLVAIAFLFTGNVALATNDWHEEQEWKVSVTGEWSACLPNEGNECGEGGGTQNRTVTYVKTKFVCPEGFNEAIFDLFKKGDCRNLVREGRHSHYEYSDKVEVVIDSKQEDEVRECETEVIACPIPDPAPEEPKQEKTRKNTSHKCEVPGKVGGFRYEIGTPGDGILKLKWVPKHGVNYADITVYDSDKTTSLRKVRVEDDGKYNITGLQNHPYWFKIRALNSCGFGDWSKKIDPMP